MKITVLTSGSKGNCSFIECGLTRFLIDIGLTYHQLQKDLEKLNKKLDDIDFLLITHTHKDHILGLAVTMKHTNFKVYIKEEMYQEIKDILPKERIEFYYPNMHIKDILVQTIKISHDAVGAVGFLIEHNDNSLVYITDTGYINEKYFPLLTNKQIYYLESNHDEKMLMEGPYPYILKQRILSDKGHLSNHMVASYLVNLVGENTKYIILAHLSEKNNTEELAYQTTKKHLEENKVEKNILVAKPYESLEMVEV